MIDGLTWTGRVAGRARAPSLGRAPIAPVVLLACLAWTLIVRTPVMNVAEGDASFYDAVAFLWRQGYLPYRDAFDVKAPGVFALTALAQSFFGPGLLALKAVAIASDALTGANLWRIGRRLNAPGAGLFAALLFPALSVFVINNTAYSALAALTTLAFAAALSPGSPMRRAGLAGLAIGAACCVKQTAAFEALALLAILAGAAEARGRRLAIVVAFAVGASLAPLAVLAYFAVHGAAGDLVRASVLDALARAHSPLENLTWFDGLARTPRMVTGIFPLLLGVALAILRRDRIFEDTRAPKLLFAWGAAAFLSLLAQRAVTAFYVTPLIAPALLLSGFALTRLPAWLAKTAPLALAAVSIWLAAAFPADRNARAVAMAGETRAAELIHSRLPTPDDRLYVVNHYSWLYSAAGLAPPTPYFSPLITLCELLPGGGARLDEIMAAQPRFVAVGNRSWGAVCERRDRWRLIQTWLDNDYRALGAAEDDPDSYRIYERVTPRP